MMIKDEARQERLNQVYGHLFAHFGIKSQVQFAEALHVQRTALSAAMNGNKAYLTKNLFIKICAAWPGVFNLDYLLTGEGELLNNGEQKQKEMPPSEQSAKHPLLLRHSSVTAALTIRDRCSERLARHL